MTTSPRALILTASPHELWPGRGVWERISTALRDHPMVSIYGILPTFGILPEATLRSSSDYLRYGSISDPEVAVLEGAIRARTWLDHEGLRFDRIVYVPTERAASRAWAMAVEGYGGAGKIRVARPIKSASGIQSLLFHDRIRRHLVGSR